MCQCHCSRPCCSKTVKMARLANLASWLWFADFFSRAHLLNFDSRKCHQNQGTSIRCLILMDSRAASSPTRVLGRAAVEIILQEIISSPSPFWPGGLPVLLLLSCFPHSTATFPENLDIWKEAWPPEVSHGAN